ncbi:MAG: hypothetical protein B6244_09135 [Candidatus Cloacimonetes bacterium 4572_55]|nr:MAG: hypothetical protein B6244_09135 [Candidatus Cloacimonetes bacterium 4572_55]
MMMKWDFSLIDAQGSPHETKKALHRHINAQIKEFAVKYNNILDIDIDIEPIDAIASFQSDLSG